MAAKYRAEITHVAEADLQEIWDYIAADSTIEATNLVDRIEEQIKTLERMPSSCPAIPENTLLKTNYRHLIIDNYRIIFRVAAKTVFVLRILHGAKLMDSSSLGA